MIELICIKDCDTFKVGEKCWAVFDDKILYDRYDVEEYWVFYTDYNYEFDSTITESISKHFFATPAEWREIQMNSILN